MTIIKAESLDLSKVTFSDVKLDQHGRKMVYINGEHGRILVQTPKMYAPNGVKRWRKKEALDNKDDKFELELSFYGENGNDKQAASIKAFHEKWNQFDDLIKNAAMEKSKEWLGKSKMSMEVVEDRYIPMVKVPMKDNEILPYPSRIRCKIDREQDSDGNFTGRFLSNKRYKTEVLLFDENKERLDFNESNAETVVPKGCQVVCVLELVYLSIATNISIKWKLVQTKVYKKQDTITDYAMLDDDDLVAESEQQEKVDLDSDNEDDLDAGVQPAFEADVGVDQDEQVELEHDDVAPLEKVVKKKTKRGVSALA